MSYIPTPEQARELVAQYNSEPFHLEHAETVSKVLGVFAAEFDPGMEDYWRTVGMLHDIDFERWPDQHCTKAAELLAGLDVDESVIRAVVSHGYGLCSDVAPERYMEKVLYTIDELTGLINACAIMRPSHSVMDMELKSVKKKYKQSSFAAGVNRAVIEDGCRRMEAPLDEVISETLAGMREVADAIGLGMAE